MRYRDIESFINACNPFVPKKSWVDFLLRGNIKKGFTLLLRKNREYDDYLFTLDDEDVEYLRKKYTPIYESLKEEKRLEEIEYKKKMIAQLTEEINN